MARAVRIHQPGPASSFVVDDVEVGPPLPGEVKIEQRAIGVNFIDINYRTGAYALAMPATLGLEACGVVTDIGLGVTHLSRGDRVAYYWRQPGAYCAVRNVPAARVVLVPKELADDVVAAVFMKGLTAEYLLRRTFRVDGRHTLVISAAAGGVGSLMCQRARALGGRVIGLVSTDEKARAALNAGAHHALTVGPGAAGVVDLAKRVKDVAGGPVDVVYDSVGKDTFEQSLDMLKPRGMLVLFGQSSGPVTGFAPHTLSKKGSLYLTRPSLHDYVHDPGEYRAASDALVEQVNKGALTLKVSATYALADAARAHAEIEARMTTRSMVLIP